MAIERIQSYFRAMEMEQRVWEFETSSATVELAAQTLGVRPARIAKTLSFALGDGCVLIVAAGDARIDNRKYKDQFQTKASMLVHEDVERLTGSAVGGVCPFALPQAAPVYLDASLKRFTTVFPACGSDNSAMEVTCDELFRYSHAKGWVDVCKDWEAGDDPEIDDEPHPDLPMPGDGELTLRFASATDADEKTGHVPAYVLDVVRLQDGAVVGEIRLRLGYVRNVYYGGNVGYTVPEEHRGHGYAEKAVRLLFEIARAHRMPYLIITCEQTNDASRKTLEHLNGTLLETRIAPRYSGIWQKGVHGEICIFRFDL